MNNVQPSTSARLRARFADEQAAARRSVDRAFPAVAAFLASEDAPQLTDADALDAYRKVYAEERTRVIKLLDSPGATLTVMCPPWCADDHQEDMTRGTFLEDFAHRGGEEALALSVDGGTEDVIVTEITQYPFGKTLRTPTVVMWPTLGMNAEAEMGPDEVRALAEQVRTYADALAETADELLKIREQGEARRRADHEGRWTR
ncbi:hypothetical protein OG266_22060 [Streptomyces sp. NBC_00554]|uniref:DUF6907 domain-containing protein n=1 Tax=Streptomyces sp. NBC_00554 TaxID=2903661 RepID=UPI00352D7D09|nr:hypothetical protein OG266_22060 [Streptomyces sp. NBC_00554]